MSRTIVEILKNYNELKETSDSNLISYKLDIDKALLEAPLNEEEKAVIEMLYLSDPIEYPIRKDGESGRPLGGTTQTLVGNLVIEDDKSENARNIRISRTIKKASEKLASYLGEPYEQST